MSLRGFYSSSSFGIPFLGRWRFNAPPAFSCLSAAQARENHHTLIMQVVRMLCAGVIHGDLSEYNMLVGSDGPVIIDLPQAALLLTPGH
jgi:serine/threonine-protein kinase RIO1